MSQKKIMMRGVVEKEKNYSINTTFFPKLSTLLEVLVEFCSVVYIKYFLNCYSFMN